MELVLISAVVLGTVMVLMAVGVIFSNRRLRGSCGGPAVVDGDGEPITCGNCGCQVAEELDSPAAEPRLEPTSRPAA